MLVIEDSSESTHSVVYSNKYMDRQTLLEQKRQRLQELKLRRLNQSEAATEIDELVDRLQYEPKLSVSVAVQTDAPTSDRHAHNYIHSEAGDPHGKGTTMHSDREKITYDKGIQAGVAVEIIQESAEEAVEPAIAEEVVGPSEEDLNSSLEKSLKTLNKLLLQDSAETDFFVDGESLKESLIRPSTSSAFSVTQILPGVEDRTIAAMDVSPRKSVIVVSYQKNSLLQKQQQQQLRLGLQADHPTSFESVIRSPGLAVVYNLQGSKPIPEAYLLATSPIFSIKFDKSGGSVSKLIGGLRSGKVVIWEVNDDSMAFLPLLISPILSSNSTSLIKGSAALGEKNLVNHTYPVTLILQRETDTITSSSTPVVTSSLDGIINYWSTSILATPRADTVQLYKPQVEGFTNLRENLSVTSSILIEPSRSSSTPTTASGSQSEDHSYLNNIIVGTQTGQLYKLCNNKVSEFIQSHSDVHPEEIYSSINSITELTRHKGHHQTDFETLLLTTSIDCGFNIWKLTHSSIEHVIYVHIDHIITKVLTRPNSTYQFISLGIDSASTIPAILFWNLQEKLMNPILRINIPEAYRQEIPTTMEFSSEGDTLYVGFKNGNVLIWSIDELLLQEYTRNQKNEKIDNGIQTLLNQIE